MTDVAQSSKRLSAHEAQHALYIDFEGAKGQPPVFLGVLRRAGRGPKPFVRPMVVDKAFASLAGSGVSLREAVTNVVMRAEKRDVRIVSWSQHDLRQVQKLRDEDPDLVARFEARYANARAVAARWRTKVHAGQKPRRGRLADYCPLVDYPVPDEAVAGRVARTIRSIRPRLERGLPVTPLQQQRWEQLVEHNRHDCMGMKEVCLVATRELESAAQVQHQGRRRTV
jgi:hypothetical protein